MTVQVLTADQGGEWIVSTESGTIYSVDLDAFTVTRVPDPDDVDTSAALRFDGQRLNLSHAVCHPLSIRDGEAGLFVIQHPTDPACVILRHTTRVRSIIRAAEADQP